MLQKAKDILHILMLVTIIGAVIFVAYYAVGFGERIAVHYEKHAYVNVPPKDTTVVNHIQPVTINNITYPQTVIREAKPDTTLRKQVEKGDIILGEKLQDGKLQEQKIDSSGRVTESTYDVKPTDKIAIDSKGDIEITEDKKAERKETFRKVVKDVEIGGAFTIGFILGRATK